MEFGRIWILRGANRWTDFPVIEAEINLGARDSHYPLREGAPLPRRLRDWRQGGDGGDMLSHTHPPWRPLDLGWLGPDANLAEVLLALTQAWQALVDGKPLFGLVHRTSQPAFYRVVFDYDEEALGKACLQAAHDFLLAALGEGPFDLAAKLGELRDLALATRLGPSTRSIVEAARRRGIPTRRLNDGSLVQLGWGKAQKRIWTAETDDTPAIAEIIAQDKQLTRELLHAVGVPVPYGRPVADADDAWAAAEEIGPPVVVKPQYGNQGRGVATDLHTREQVLGAYDTARAISPHILVEKFIPGADHRFLVVGGKLAAAALREPAHVVGDGQATIAQLIEAVNRDPRRSDGHATVLSWIKLDALGLTVLAEQGYGPDSVPPAGAKVLIRRNANLSTGGTATDVTERVHPDLAAQAIDAARAVGLDIAGVDVVAESLDRPLGDHGVVVEVNAGPGLRMHLEPSAGSAHDVGAAIVDALFPPGQTGRIPVVAVTGTNGKTTTSRIIAHLLRGAGRSVGMTCTDGIYLDGRRTETRDCSGPQSARSVLLNPRIEVAVLETARGGILREGLGFDQCDVAVITNIGKGDHLGLRGIETVEELTRVKEVVVRAVSADGYALLNAADPLVVAMSRACRGRLLFFAAAQDNLVLAGHRAAGGRVAFTRDGRLVLAEGSREDLLDLDAIPFTRHGGVPFQVENALAAAAAGWCLGLTAGQLRTGLETFTGKGVDNPGRFNVLEAGDAVVIVDYAHNPSAVSALVAGLGAFPHPHRTLIFSGCNRRDIDLVEMGTEAGQAFDQVILYPDWGHSGRNDGELNAVLRQGLARGHRVRKVVEMPNERKAIELAIATLQPGDLLVVGVQAIEESLAFVQEKLRELTG